MQFIHYLGDRKTTAVTRKRKLAAIRGFLKDNEIIFGNPADTIDGPIREERDSAILLKTEYKALLQVAGGSTRDLAIVMLFLQTGLRVSELVNLKLSDIDFTSREITVRQGKGRKDRVVPLVKQAEAALKADLKVRGAQPEYDEVFIARNGTSMDPRTVRYRIQKYYKEAGIKKKASVHTLRHTFSTHQIHNGLKIKQYAARLHSAEQHLSDDLLREYEPAKLELARFYRMTFQPLKACEAFPRQLDQMSNTRRILRPPQQG